MPKDSIYKTSCFLLTRRSKFKVFFSQAHEIFTAIEVGFDNRNVRYNVINGKVMIVALLTFESTSFYRRANSLFTRNRRERSKLINTSSRKLDV